VRLTWGNHYWSAMGSALNLGVDPADRWLCCLPLNHVGGLSILVRSVLYGNTVELHGRFDPEQTNRAIRERGVTIVSVVANMLQRMLDSAGDEPYPPSLRAILVGGGATPAALTQRCRSAQLPILLTYGLTETASQVATVAPNDVTLDCGVGRPLSFAEVRITGDDGAPAAPGHHGHIEVRGPIVSPGYLGDDDRTPDEWLHTRDRGWIDERGYLHVLGRGDETIVCGGENVHPREVERALESHPAVAEAFAAGVDDEQWGVVLHAAVRTAGAVDESELAEHCRRLLANYKIPRRIFLVEDFPRTPAGKIARADAARALGALAIPT
jgi:O-succinylbenzoic acid--CoA ligase